MSNETQKKLSEITEQDRAENEWKKVAEKHRLIGGFCHGGEIFIPAYAGAIEISTLDKKLYWNQPKQIRVGFVTQIYNKTVLKSGRVVFRISQAFSWRTHKNEVKWVRL